MDNPEKSNIGVLIILAFLCWIKSDIMILSALILPETLFNSMFFGSILFNVVAWILVIVIIVKIIKMRKAKNG